MSNKILKNIPNAITCLNLVSGCVAIIIASKGATQFWGMSAYMWAFIFIGIAAVADFLDGFMARLLNAYSNLGKELDSLCDLVSFGVAPAMIIFNATIYTSGAEWAAWTALLIPVFGALRLAKFNIDDTQSLNFKGLPIPANAIFWIGFASLCYANKGINPWMIVIITIIMSYMMVSPIRMYSLKFQGFAFSANAKRYILIFAAIFLVATNGLPGMMWLILYYIISSIGLNRRTRID